MVKSSKTEKNIGTKITGDITKWFRNVLSLRRILYINQSIHPIFKEIENISDKGNLVCSSSIDDITEKFDLIIGDLSFGHRRKEEWSDSTKGVQLRSGKNWIILFKSLFHLSDQGYGLYSVEPSITWSTPGFEFIQKLNNNGFYINAIINTPENILWPSTSFRPILILISRKKLEKIFISELGANNNPKELINNFKDYKRTKYLEKGLFVSLENFKGFYNYKIKKQIEILETQYKEYKNYILKDISIEIIPGKINENFKNKENCLYIPKIGTPKVVTDLKQVKNKHQNYFQVVIDNTIAKAKYIELFFKTDMGRLILNSLVTDSFIPYINKENLEKSHFPIPGLHEQQLIIDTGQKLDKLKIVLKQFENELSLNPKNCEEIQDKLDSMFDKLSVLSDSDRIRSIIREGESKTVEFKQTLSMDIKSRKKEKYIEHSVLKTIVAFLNTEGGNLLIGVNDHGETTGINDEISKYFTNDDGYLKKLRNMVKERIGIKHYDSINYHIVCLNENKICHVNCKKSNIPCYLDKKEFYIRTNPATDKLEGPEMVEYINLHFGKGN